MNLLKYFSKALFLLVVTTLFCFEYHYLKVEVPSSCIVDKASLQDLKLGDLILRKGKDADSHFICQVSGGNYSHIGMVTKLYPSIEITHATLNDKGVEDGVVVSSLENFFDSKAASKGLILRLDFINKDNVGKVIEEVSSHLGQSFLIEPSIGISPKSEHSLYCTTLILKGISKVNKDLYLNWRYLDMPLMRGYYLYPQAFIESDKAKVIYKF